MRAAAQAHCTRVVLSHGAPFFIRLERRLPALSSLRGQSPAQEMTNAGHHRLLVNIQTSAMRMQKFHRSSSAPLAWSPDRRNLESVLRGGKLPVATIRGAQGVPGPTVTRADAHQSHTDLYALDARALYTNTLARFIYRGSETPVGDCYETRISRLPTFEWITSEKPTCIKTSGTNLGH